MGFFKSIADKLKKGLSKTREAVGGAIRSVLLGRRLDEALITDLETRLIQADVGVATTRRLIDRIRADFRAGKMTRGEEVLDYLKREIRAMWPEEDRRLNFATSGPTVILVSGVNGAGKTTTIAKLTYYLQQQGKRVLLGAGDTFRAGAVRQLEIWADRLGVEIVKGQQGGDPAAVAFDACKAALARGVDVLILDTAGRLHTQDPLMRQLTKMRDIAARQLPGAPHEVLLVLDATTGQNAVRQAEEFGKAIGVSGIVLAKLDGTARGGVVIAIRESTKIPVKFVGVGETLEDLEPFDPGGFVEAMFSEDEPAAATPR